MNNGFALLLCFFCTGASAEAPLSKRALIAVRQGPLPSVVSRFASRLEKARSSPSLFEKVRPLLKLPVTVRETAYQPAGASCLRYFRKTSLVTARELGPFLKVLAEVFHQDPIREFKDGLYGVATPESCSHIAGVELDEKQSQIAGLTVDAQDSVWTPARQDFSATRK